MKNLIIAVFGLLVLTACEGEQGPPGPPGPEGPYIIGTVFEIANVNFNPANEYSFLGFYYDYISANIEIYPSDVVLIYLHNGVVDGNDLWNLMPQTFYFNDGGIVEYSYNFTEEDFEIYLQGNIDLNTLPPSYTQNQIFRIVILPADFASNPKVDITNYHSVVSAMKAQNPDFEVIELENK